MTNNQLSAISYQRLAEALVFPHCTMVLTPIHFSVFSWQRAQRSLPANPAARTALEPMAAIATKLTL